MTYFFSGINSNEIFEIANEAGVQHIVVDRHDLKYIPEGWNGTVWMDSGAYADFRQGRSPMDVLEYIKFLAEARSKRNHLKAAFAYDVIGDEGETQDRWEELMSNCPRDLELNLPIIPIWHYGDHKGRLLDYMAQNQEKAKDFNIPTVAIGALAMPMRNKEMEAFKLVNQITQFAPKEIHALGLNWIKAINEIYPACFSADSSKALDAARYGTIAFIHKNGKLSIAPARVLPEYEHLATQKNDSKAQKGQKRRERLLITFRVMNEYLNGSNEQVNNLVTEQIA